MLRTSAPLIGALGSSMKSSSRSVIEESLRRAIEPGESVICVATPGRGVRLRRFDIIMIPHSVILSAILVIVWIFPGGFAIHPALRALLSALFMLICFYLTVGRFLLDAKTRANTLFGLTNRRVIIVSGILLCGTCRQSQGHTPVRA